MKAYEPLRQQFFQVYVFDPVADLPAPGSGQIIIVKDTPDFGVAHIVLVTDGVKTVRQLYNDWKTNQVTPQAVMAAITAEQNARISADSSLQQQITALQQAANRALVFDNRAKLDMWMASGGPLPAPNPPYTPADVQIGWLALFRKTGEGGLWWDGGQWRDHEINLDLSGYRTAAEQDAIDKTLAPIHSPVFTGIPQVTVPDYTIPLQAAPVSELVYVLELVANLFRGNRRILERGIKLRPVYRCMERDATIKRKTERAVL